MNKTLKLSIIIGTAIIICFLYITWLFGSKYGPDSKPDYITTPIQIEEEYQLNAVNAREKYEGKLIGLRNVEVLKIAESLTGVPQVIIPGGRIYFQKKSSVENLSPGDKISCNAVLSVIGGYDCQFEPCYNIEKVGE
jgi:hypothetical protein